MQIQSVLDYTSYSPFQIDENRLPGLCPDSVAHSVHMTLYLPDCDAGGKTININYWVAAAAQLLAHKFGGVSVSPAYKGYWHNPKTKQLIEETTFLVSVLMNCEDLQDHGASVDHFIRKFAKETGQGEVLVTMNDQVLRYTS